MNILPDKHTSIENTILWSGMKVLKQLKNKPLSVEELWYNLNELYSYKFFIETLDMLYILKLIEINDGKLNRREKQT